VRRQSPLERETRTMIRVRNDTEDRSGGQEEGVMPITTEDLQAMVEQAVERVQRNWTPPGRTLNVLTAGDIRPLTTGALEMYLSFYAWLWRRDPPEDERKDVGRRLTNVATDADWGLRDAVLRVCALWDQVRARSPEDQETLRDLLSAAATVGSYPELQRHTLSGGPEPGGATPFGVPDFVEIALKNFPGPPSPPG
ncbi:MAG: hypothetical protein ABR518_07590, partial [Actinomycetota bacterium]